MRGSVFLFSLFSAVAGPGVALGTETRDRVLELKDGGTLRYGISTPKPAEKTDDATAPRPLVLALHYGWQGDLPAGYGRSFLELLVAPGLGELGAVIVAPDCPENSWTHPRAEQAVLELIEQVRETHVIDDARIVVTGFSVGAMGTWFLASRHPDLFSAAIPMAGPPVLVTVSDPMSGLQEAARFLKAEPVVWPASLLEMPMLVIHSCDDELVPVQMASEAVRTLREAGGQIEFSELEKIGHFETPRYAEHLARAIPWLRQVWQGASSASE